MPQINANDPLVGRRLGGRVEIRALLGAGGMGRVYRGWHLATSTQVAVKVLAPRADQPALAKRLNVEVVAARRLKHPNVVQVLEAGVDPTDNVLYVVMEYVEGKDLGRLLADGKRLPIPRACAILREVLAALEAAHALNVLHRDIKPGNIMLTRSREPDGGYRDQMKVVDFGLAKLSGELTSLTETGFVAGTPGFMAPEQALGEELDGRADVYACGITLYRMLSIHRRGFGRSGALGGSGGLERTVAGQPRSPRVRRWHRIRRMRWLLLVVVGGGLLARYFMVMMDDTALRDDILFSELLTTSLGGVDAKRLATEVEHIAQKRKCELVPDSLQIDVKAPRHGNLSVHGAGMSVQGTKPTMIQDIHVQFKCRRPGAFFLVTEAGYNFNTQAPGSGAANHWPRREGDESDEPAAPGSGP